MTSDLNNTSVQGVKVVSEGPGISLESGADPSLEQTDCDVLFAALAAAGIRTVIVDFEGVVDGYSDTIKINSAYRGSKGEREMKIPTTPVNINVVTRHMLTVEARPMTEVVPLSDTAG